MPARSHPFWILRIMTNLAHIVHAYRLVSVQSIHCYCCSLKKNWFWRQSQRKLRFSPHLDVIKTSNIFCVWITVYIKPLLIHLPLCRSQCSPGSVHLKSMQPRHLEVIGSQVGWGELQSWLLEQPRNMYFLFNEQEKTALLFSIFWLRKQPYKS